MVARIGRRGFVGGAAALSAGLWPPLPGRAASAMDFDEARHLLSRTPSARRRPRSAPSRRRTTPARSIACWPAVRRDAADAGAGLDQRGTGRAARASRQAAVAEQKTGVDGKQLQVVRPVQEQGRELRNWWVEEMLATDQPLTERMVLFWHNHFTSSFQKVALPAGAVCGRTRCSAARRSATSRRC